MTAFDGFPAAAFSWFEGLEADNSKAYFDRTRDVYEDTVRGPLEAVLDEEARARGGGVKVFRQHRDVRFSRDKSPYKLNAYGLVFGLDSGSAGGLYAAVNARGLTAGGGYYTFARDQLERYRAAAAAAPGAEILALLERADADGFELLGETLKTAPRGVPRDHAHARALRHTGIAAVRRLPARGRGIGRDRALAFLHDAWSALEPLTAWLDEHVGAGTELFRR